MNSLLACWVRRSVSCCGFCPSAAASCGQRSLEGLHFLGVGPQGGDRGTDRQRFTVTVGDQAAVSRDRDVTQAARIALPLEEITVDYLQVDDAPADGTDHQRQQADHHAEAPG